MTTEDQLSGLRVSAPIDLAEKVELGTGLRDGFQTFDSPVGEVTVAFNPNGVSSVGLAGDEFFERFRTHFGRDLTEARPPRGWERLIKAGIEAGTPGELPLDLRKVSAFRQTVMMIATTIPRGQVRPYQWLAQEAGKPGAARAVGSTMANNPVPLIVPCHRVVRADGSIGQYSLGGVENKRLLLTIEGWNPQS